MLFRVLRPLLLALALIAALCAWQPWRAGAASAEPDALADGVALYDRFCLACHGSFGDGRGPAAPWLWPRPRDFTRGEYKWRTTASGAPPTDLDLRATIAYGVPGTSMHAFGPILRPAQLDSLVAVVKAFAPEAFAKPATLLTPGAEIEPDDATPELIARGRVLYESFGCLACHGRQARGDGPAAGSLIDVHGVPNPPYDLTAQPLRRPRPADADTTVAIYQSLISGLSGTPMPAYPPSEELWAVAAYVNSIRYRAVVKPGEGVIADIPELAIELDRQKRGTRAGYWPGHGTEAEMRVFGETIPLQGPPPSQLGPAQASLSAEQCTRCHAKQRREWNGSLHAHASSPGLIAQLIREEHNGAFVESCQRCHNPLPEQLPILRPGHVGGDDDSRAYTSNPAYDAALRAEGITCAACHVRGHERHGPPRLAASGLLPLPGYPLTEMSLYERADLCAGCHQLPARLAVNGRPLLDTYREWLEGPYMKRGIQCQHCHMPNREHTWKGVHDPDTFRQGIRLESIAARSPRSGVVSVRARVTNVGAGHYLPTTPTPAAWLEIELIDARGELIDGASARQRIGRHLEFERGAFRELEDTRIPPGESLELARAWKQGRTKDATHARVRVRVHPDDYYEGLYRQRLEKPLDPEVRALFEAALERAQSSYYVAEEQRIALD